MDLAVRGLERLAICLGHRQAGNRHWLAPQGLPVVLDLESSPWPTWSSTGVKRNPPTDSEDEPRESALGRAPHPRRAADYSALISARPAWASTYRAGGSHRRKTRGLSLRIASRQWCRSISSPCRPCGFRSCTCSWFWLTTKADRA